MKQKFHLWIVHLLFSIILSDKIESMKKKHIYLILLILWMTLIFCLSNQPASDSSNLSNGLLNRILYILNIQVNPQLKEFLEKFIRKLAHFVEYFVLGLLMLMTLKGYKVKNAYLVAFILCVIYASSDEFHQSFVLNRYASVFDVLLDSSGSFLAIFFSNLIDNKCCQGKKH